MDTTAAEPLHHLDSPPDPRDPIQRTMRVSVLEGSATQVFLNWTSGSVLVGYMLHLGASPTEIALVASVPLLAQAASPLAALAAAVLGRRKLLTAVVAVLGRGIWVLAAVLPAMRLPAALLPGLMVLLVLVSSAFQAANGTLWSAWMGDVVPEKRRGRYFGYRAGVVGMVGMLANLAAGWFLDRVAAPVGFQVVIAVAVASAGLGVGLYFLQYDPPTPRRRAALREVLLGPLQDANFRRFLTFAVYWQFVVLLCAPFVIPYFLEQLKLSFTQVAVWSAIAAVSALVTTNLWGRVADRVGNKAVLAIGTFFAGTLLPATWILAGFTGHVYWIWLAGACDALAWGAITPALFNLALASAPQRDRVAFIAMYSLVSGVAGFLGGVISGPLLTLFQQIQLHVFDLTWTGYHWLFLVSGVGRSQAWRLLRPVREVESWRTRDLLREMRTGWRRIGFPWR
jgi:MFS family permease